MGRTVIGLAAIVSLFLVACGGGRPPKADAGPDFSVAAGQSPTFNGCGSTGDIVNYRWTVLSPPPAMARDAGKVIRELDAHCSFTLEEKMAGEYVGDWVIQLEVRDARGQTATDTVAVTVVP